MVPVVRDSRIFEYWIMRDFTVLQNLWKWDHYVQSYYAKLKTFTSENETLKWSESKSNLVTDWGWCNTGGEYSTLARYKLNFYVEELFRIFLITQTKGKYDVA